MDKFQQIAETADFPVGLIGNPLTGDFQLIDLTTAPMSEHFRTQLRQRGMYFLGVTGLVMGVPSTRLTEPLDPFTVDLLAWGYIAHVEAAVKAALGAFTLARIHDLPDPRTN